VRIVVTGGTGAVGRFVVRALLEAGEGRVRHDVTVFDATANTAAPGGVDADGVRQVRGDIRDLGQVYGALHGADAVIHLAGIRRPGIATDDVVFATNVLGTFNVHEAAWRLGVPRVVSTSSEAALGWDYRRTDLVPAYLPIDEDHPVRPQDPYGLSKVAGEAVARSYAARGLEVAVLRPPWVVMPDGLEQLRADGGRRMGRFGLASYIDVRDLAEAYRLAVEAPAERLAANPVLFIVADDPSIAEPLREFMPRTLPAIGRLAADLREGQAAVSNERAKVALGWRPRRSWRQAAPAEDDAAAGQWDH
jgi:nucleoside-diphosphate-sugar epimerase